MAGPGRPKTGGRQKGSLNKVTREKQAMIQKLAPDGSDPIAFWMELLKNPDTPLEIRMIAARDVAPYRHPKLASVEARVGGKSHEQRLEELLAMEARDNDEL
jgi:hypothetical protein